MEQIMEKHKGLIAGMSKIYDTLIAMRYFSNGDVIRLPVNEQTLPFSQLQSLGYDSEVLDLIKVLPMLSSEIVWGFQDWGVELLPRSKAVTYFPNPGDPDFLNDLRWGDFYKMDDPNEMKWLHPWMLKLTDSGQYGYGTTLIYNTRDRTAPSMILDVCDTDDTQSQLSNGQRWAENIGMSYPTAPSKKSYQR